MADKRCKNGHFIDESWDICPYCPPVKGAPVEASRAARHEPAPRREAPPQAPPPARPPAAPLPAPAVVPPERTVSAPKLEVDREPEHARFTVGWLVCLDGEAKGESYAVRIGKNTIGRDRKSDIHVNDEQASGHHADLVFRPEEERFILMDRNSTNGTYVNDVELEPRRDLVDHDIVTIGRHKFLFVTLLDGRFRWDERDSGR